MHRKPWAFAPLVLAVIVGCNKSPEPTAEGTSTTGTTTAGTTGTTGTTGITPPAVTTGLKDLKIEDVKTGKGSAAAKGDTVWVMYSEHLSSPTGKVIDSTEKRMNRALGLTVGGAQVIEGWDKGLVGMKVGGERNLYVPYRMAFGATGSDTVPPKTDLFLNLKAVALVKQGEEDLIDIAVKKKGSGPMPKPGDKVTVSYVGTLPSGDEFDSSKGAGVSFTIGKPDAKGVRAMPGMEFGVAKMNVGEEAILTIPPKLGKPAGTMNIPSNSVLIFDVTLKKIG